MARRFGFVFALAAVALVGAVASVHASAPPTSEPPATSDVTQIVVGPECADRDGATVTQLPDVVVPAVTVAPVESEDVEIGGDTIAGVTVDVVSEQTIAEVVVPGVTADGARTEQVCQIEIEGELPTVSRAGVVREGVSRPGAARPGASRPARCVDDDCLPELQVEAVRIEPAALPDVDVNPGRLQSQDLRPDVDVLTGDGESAFVTPGDVLFDSDQAVIRPEAAEALGRSSSRSTQQPPPAHRSASRVTPTFSPMRRTTATCPSAGHKPSPTGSCPTAESTPPASRWWVSANRPPPTRTTATRTAPGTAASSSPSTIRD